ncbi:hypothetical protein [Zophobihabitans entericus]|uniref:Uncharacterized protein n=1 Tax=Zophobihabitans entericus TaxID=1635327 RepID=A0A6G9I8F7_9GAMM|nr:hypothetical protein [Zophobihabitans entericus]QIQ20495.1 hypothetical protein IPMB12_01630 [Zophobihabitans entericus]
MKSDRGSLVSTPNQSSQKPMLIVIALIVIGVTGYLAAMDWMEQDNASEQAEQIAAITPGTNNSTNTTARVTSEAPTRPLTNAPQVADPAPDMRTSTPTTTQNKPTAQTTDPYPRTVYLYHPNADKTYNIVKATFITQSLEPNDAKLVTLIKNSDGSFSAIDNSTNRRIPNVKDLTAQQNYYTPKTLYADSNNLILLTKQIGGTGSAFVIRKVNTFNGNVEWTLNGDKFDDFNALTIQARLHKNMTLLNISKQNYLVDAKGQLTKTSIAF